MLGLTEIVAGRFDAALANYTESKARYEAGKIPAGVAHAWTGIGFSHAAREKFADAIPAYRTAIRLFEAEKENEGAGRAWLGLSIAQSGALDYPAALESAQKVRTIAALVKSEDLAWRADVRVGEVLRKLTKVDEARQSFQNAITAIDRLAADAPTNPEARRHLDDSASAWSGLALALASQGDAPGALAAVEARRAHVRRVQLGGFQRDITRGTTPEERAEEQAIVRELISTRVQLKAELTAAKPDAARQERLQQQLATLVARRADQQARLYARLPELQQWRGLSPVSLDWPALLASPKPLSAADELNAFVPDARALLVEYLLADDELLIVSVAHRDAAPASPPASPKPQGGEGGLAEIERRLNALEASSRDSGLRNASVLSARSSDAEIIRRVRDLLAQSENKQQGELALRISQVIRDVDAQRVADLTRIQQGLRGIEASVTAEAAGHRELTNYILTSARQK